MPFRWNASHLALLASADRSTAPLIAAADVPRAVPELDLWDHWPVLDEDGRIADIAGGTLVVALSAPMLSDPEMRHDIARLRLLHRRRHAWRDLGPLLPNGFSPGSREWAGSAVIDSATGVFRLFYTATGVRGEGSPTFGQRLLETRADLQVDGGEPHLSGWIPPVEIIRPDGLDYEIDMAGGGCVGTIKAFRDPYVIRDEDGCEMVLFSGSLAGASSKWNGLVGAARRKGTGWQLLSPVVDATGINNELERPHAIRHRGCWYLFWSTQAKTFAPGATGPTGLYGIVAKGMTGPWRPLNGHGLVLANPAEAPAQAYSWQVLPDLQVWSFADLVGLATTPHAAAATRAHFAGTPAPPLRLALHGDRTRLIASATRL